jgi:hypothetical protein
MPANRESPFRRFPGTRALNLLRGSLYLKALEADKLPLNNGSLLFAGMAASYVIMRPLVRGACTRS